uniref:oxaloacetate tautomerase n=1 Tax=Timema californicum TaxID=61474 RepID=A0A7R9J1K2_TIMCA|nr:unnamed protein product [Timema californicum]
MKDRGGCIRIVYLCGIALARDLDSCIGNHGRDELPPWLPGSSVRFQRDDRDKEPSRRALLAENKLPKPSEPFFFLKPTSSYIVEGQDVKVPAGAVVNEEVELGVIIGKSCKNVTVNEAMNYVGGYCLALDMTEANFVADSKKKGLPWTFGKGFDTACPVSRFVSVEELKDPSDVNIWLKVNGRKIQDANTSDLAFTIPELIASITRYITLEPGDLILTVGTFLHLLAAITSPLVMPHAKVVMSSVVRGFPSGGLTGPHVTEPTLITLCLKSEYCAVCLQIVWPNYCQDRHLTVRWHHSAKHTGISLPYPSQGRNVDKRRKKVRQSIPCVNETQEVEGPQPLFLAMSRIEYVPGIRAYEAAMHDKPSCADCGQEAHDTCVESTKFCFNCKGSYSACLNRDINGTVGDPLPKVLSDTCTPEESTLRPFPKSYSWNTPRSFAFVISVAEVCLLFTNVEMFTGSPPGIQPVQPGDVMEAGLGDILTINFPVKLA